MAENVFDEKQDYIIAARDEVIKRDEYAANVDRMKQQNKKLSKNIASEEKSISDEIATTIRKRRQEIQSTYDDRLDDNRARKKKVANKRDKKKEERMDKRYHEETKGLRESDKDLQVEMQTLLRKYKLPSFCGKKLYFALFYARNVKEFGLKILSFLIGFCGIPGFVTILVKKLVLDTKKDINVAFWCALVAAGTFILLLLIYFAIYSRTKIKHMDALTQARSIRDKMIANKRQAKAIRHSISKDHDDSQYNLDAYDEKLDNLDAEADAIGKEKQEALRTFEEETTAMITEEINNRRLPALEALKEEKANLENEVAAEEKRFSDQTLLVANKYAAVLGEDLCRQDKLEELIAIMQEGQAETVSEAIRVYKGQRPSK
ncbi:MAG: hypothetical protein SO015_04330 [Wujia sp.]|nr:hypothetical protein [Wujia sp.]MDD7283846.1 hypothetical protein [Clostridium sp.]MDY3727367.1 hypothetical protein [Wujia sp.]